LFSQPISSKGGEQYALQKLFEDYDDLVDEAMTMQPRDLRGMSPDVMAGLLYSREAQLNKAYGPESQGGMMALPQHLGNKDVLFRLTEPYRSAAARTNETGVRAGIGPHTLGRARTTEEAIYRMLRQGSDPDDIANDLLREMRGETGGMKDYMREHIGWDRLSAHQREALDMIMHKVSRILNGNPNHKDSWVDIEGYAHIVAIRIPGD
jgi:hypothetical protein